MLLMLGIFSHSTEPQGSRSAPWMRRSGKTTSELTSALVLPKSATGRVPWASIIVGLVEVVRDATVVLYRGGPAIGKRFGADVFIRRLSHVAIARPDEIAELEAEARAAQSRLTE